MTCQQCAAFMNVYSLSVTIERQYSIVRKAELCSRELRIISHVIQKREPKLDELQLLYTQRESERFGVPLVDMPANLLCSVWPIVGIQQMVVSYIHRRG